MYTAKKRRQTKGVYGAKGTFKKPRARRGVVPGITREVGYYGRYSADRGGELKFFDLDLNDADIAQAGTVVDSINHITQDVTENARVGRKCTIKSIHWRFMLELAGVDAQATAGGSETVRLILFLDKQCNGATATTTDLLEADNFQAYRNLVNTGRFDFLMDKTVSMNHLSGWSDGAGLTSQDVLQKNFVFNRKCNTPIEFNGTTGAIAQIRSNNFGILLITAVGELVRLDSKIRLRFSDGS